MEQSGARGHSAGEQPSLYASPSPHSFFPYRLSIRRRRRRAPPAQSCSVADERLFDLYAACLPRLVTSRTGTIALRNGLVKIAKIDRSVEQIEAGESLKLEAVRITRASTAANLIDDADLSAPSVSCMLDS